jgi:solute carrier family 25 folate transporter 32
MQIIVKAEGFFTLYNGLSASMFGVLHPLIYWPLYEKSKIYCKKHLDTANTDDPDKISDSLILISAISCKAVASACTYPHEVLRARMQDVRRYEN